MKEVSLKDAQVALQKTISWTKKSRKGIIEWQKTFYEVGMQHKKLKTLVKAYFVSEVIMFQETLEYVNQHLLHAKNFIFSSKGSQWSYIGNCSGGN